MPHVQPGAKSASGVKVFLSYCWHDTAVADRVDRDLLELQMQVVRDVRDVQYRDSLGAFMERIRGTDFAVLLISDSYLKSRNCMTEVLHLLRERDFEKKLLPVIVGDAAFHDPSARLIYTNYWKTKVDDLTEAVSSHPPTAVLSSLKDLKSVQAIHSQINEFLGYISDIKYIRLEDLRAEGYRTLIEAMGGLDVTYLVELLRISSEPDPEQGEIALDAWFDANRGTSPAYSLRARLSIRKGQFARAAVNFERALELDPDNIAALNNFGHMLFRLGKNLTRARTLLEHAIALAPTLTEARLNLGVLLSSRFNDSAGAREQYEAVISYDPSEPKSYNNLANLLRTDEPENTTRIRELFKTALKLKPDYFDARLNYVNYLAESLGELNEAEAELRQMVAPTTEQQELVTLMFDRIAMLRKRSTASASRRTAGKAKQKRKRKKKR